MNKLLKYLPAVLIFASALVGGIAHAQVSAPNYFTKFATSVYPLNPASTTFGTSTLNGVFKNFTVNGTCTGCGVTSTGVTSFNGATGTITYAPSTTIPTNNNQLTNGSNFITANVNGNVTSTSLTTGTSTANDQLFQVNSKLNIPDQTFLTNLGCPGFPSDHTLDTCMNDWYNFNSSTVSSTLFYPSPTIGSAPYTWSDTSGIRFTNNNEFATIYCAPALATKINVTATTGTIYTAQWGTLPSAGGGMYGCDINSSATANTFSTSTGATIALLNAPYVTLRDNHFTQGSVQLYLNTNTYLNTFEDNYFGFAGGYEVYAPNSGNSGESNTFLNNTFGPLGNSTTTHCLFFNTQSTNIIGRSNDGCTGEVGGLGHVALTLTHTETINSNSTYGAYIPWVVDAGGVLTATNIDVMGDGVGASTTPAFFSVASGGSLIVNGIVVWANPSSTPIIATGTGSISIIGVDISHSVGTQVAPTSSITVSGGTGVQYSQGNMIWGTALVNTAANNVTLTFAKPFVFKPACFAINATSSANIVRSGITTTSTFQFLDTSNFPTTSVENWFCLGLPN